MVTVWVVSWLLWDGLENLKTLDHGEAAPCPGVTPKILFIGPVSSEIGGFSLLWAFLVRLWTNFENFNTFTD